MAVEITDSTFKDVIEKPGVALVDFWAPWCGPCKVQGPIIEALAEEMKDVQVTIGKLNVDENPTTAQAHQVMSIPTLIFFKDGKPVEQLIGLQNKGSIAAALDRHLAS